MSSGSFKNVIYLMSLEIIYLKYTYKTEFSWYTLKLSQTKLSLAMDE